tara:strand:+ start:701 stop:1294 length:594 start_codon:yes stop_codon:yes gene_type:complete
MPTNLNALIRYKRIDACLKNPYVICTINRLQEACTEALGEFRGIYKLVSERTIREDLKIMRSEILGFNAPIKFENGKYFYSDKQYSIFSTPITEAQLLENIFQILLKERKNFVDNEIDKLIEKISVVIGKPIPTKILRNIRSDEILNAPPQKSDSGNICGFVSSELGETSDYLSYSILPDKKIPEPLLMWKKILDIF